MLEASVNQGIGLQSLALQAAPRMIALASHGTQRGELPLLWSLCSTLVATGYSVAVLDALTHESSRNPGLAQLLDNPNSRQDEEAASVSWSVLPAAQGLQRLCVPSTAGRSALMPLSELFQNFEVVLIYARAELLARLMPNTGIEPLLAVSPSQDSAMTAYRALKQLLLGAKLRPTMASLIGERSSNPGATSVTNLQDCAKTFLNYRLDCLRVRALQSPQCLVDDMHKLASHLLEKAIPMYRNQLVGSP